MLERYRCVSQTLKEIGDEKNSSCRTHQSLCKRTKYKAESFSAQWPVSTLIKLCGEWYVEPRLTELAKMNIRARSLIESGKSYEKLGKDPALQTLLIRENYLSIVINIASPTVQKSVEILAYPIPNLFSDIGGILGLYLGASVLSVCELLEACYVFYKKVIIVKAFNENENPEEKAEEKRGESVAKVVALKPGEMDPDEFTIKLPNFKQ